MHMYIHRSSIDHTYMWFSYIHSTLYCACSVLLVLYKYACALCTYVIHTYICILQEGVTADTAVEVVNDLTSTVGEGSDEDQNTENLEVINEVLSTVTELIGTGNFTANEDVRIFCMIDMYTFSLSSYVV